MKQYTTGPGLRSGVPAVAAACVEALTVSSIAPEVELVGSGDPGASVPIGLDPVRATPDFKVELVGEAAEMRR